MSEATETTQTRGEPVRAAEAETVDTVDTVDGADQVDEAPEAEAPARKRGPMRRATRIRLIVILVIALVVGGLLLGRYLLDARSYVTTDNAQVDGNQISVNAPASGTLIDWRGQQGTTLHEYAPVGRIEMQGSYAQPQMVVRAPADGVVAVDNGVEGSFVTAGTQLAVAYDGSGVFVTARVDETDIDEVHTGAAVNVSVDAFPDAHLTGHVVEVQTGSAGVFSLFPQSNTSGNFQKVTQVIPVKITLDDLQGLPLVPGMNTTVKIHRR